MKCIIYERDVYNWEYETLSHIHHKVIGQIYIDKEFLYYLITELYYDEKYFVIYKHVEISLEKKQLCIWRI